MCHSLISRYQVVSGRYLSHDIIDELLELMGNTVLRSMVDQIRRSQQFSLIADDSRDITNKEQLTVIIKWVEKSDLSSHESFTGMYDLPKADAEGVTEALIDVVLRCNLDVKSVRWQVYDGAATMAGRRSGVAA